MSTTTTSRRTTTTRRTSDDEQPAQASASRVVVPLDGTYESIEALRWARCWSELHGGALAAVRAWRPGIGQFLPARQEVARRRIRDELRRWAAREPDAPAAPDLAVVDGELDVALLTIARTSPGALIAVGTAPPAHLDAGEIATQARRIVRAMPGPIAIVPSAGASRPPRRIVVGVDGSPTSLAAVAWLADLPGIAGTAVTIVTCWDAVLEWVPSDSERSARQRARAALDGPWTAALRAAGAHIDDATLVDGIDPADALAGEALRRHADVLVVGMSHRTGHLRTRRGAIAAQLAHDTGLATIAVPLPA